MGKLKHLSVQTLWLQAYVKRGALHVEMVGTKSNKPDLGRKTRPEARLVELRKMCGLWLPREGSMLEEGSSEERMAENVRTTLAWSRAWSRVCFAWLAVRWRISP